MTRRCRSSARFHRAVVVSVCVLLSASLTPGSGERPSRPDSRQGNLQAAPPAPGEQDHQALYLPGELIVKLETGTEIGTRAAVQARVAARTVKSFRSGGELWTLGADFTTEDALRLLADEPSIEYAEPNYLLWAELTPNDPRYPDLYGLNNTGQTGGTPGADIDAERAWDITTGTDTVVVGVIDSGVDYTHVDLADNIWTNPGEIPDNGLDDDGNGYVDDIRGWDFVNNDNDPMDDHSHGTHVSGTISGVGNNGIGVVGVSWRVKIMPLKFLGAGGSGSTADAVEAVEYATMMGADITSNSWGGGGFSQALLDAINAGGDAGVLFAAAAGNDSSNTDSWPHYPSSYDSDAILSVAATDHNDNLAGFSNYGVVTVDLGAPGVNTLSTIPGGNYGYKSGTSMATPHVAGAAALLRSIAPGMDIPTIKGRLMNEGEAIPALAGRTVSGKRLNAFFSVREPDDVDPGMITDLTVVSVDINEATLNWTATGDDGSSGRATSYHLRHSLSPLTEANFDEGTLVTNVPAPKHAGGSEEVVVDGLRANTNHYFAIKAVDEWGNQGPISNVPSATTLPGIPDIALLGDLVMIESVQTYGFSGDRTLHDLPVAVPPEGGGDLELVADGDYGDPSETATAIVEGLTLGSVGGTGVDCSPARDDFPVVSDDLSNMAADGIVSVEVRNSAWVDVFCGINEHLVRLGYRTSAATHDYGDVFVGGGVPWTITIENRGNDVLVVHSITTDAPEFVPSDGSVSLEPGTAHELVVTFVPSGVSSFQGTLRIQSNDPDEGNLTADLTGVGLAPPDIEVTPDRFDEALLSGETVSRTLTISNTGLHDLEYEIATAGPEPGGASGGSPRTTPIVVESGDPLGGSSTGGGFGRPKSTNAPPSDPPAIRKYDDGTHASRERTWPEDITEVVDSEQQMKILLIYSGSDVVEIRSLLEAFPDIAAVDVFDVHYVAPPTLSELMEYGAVIVTTNNAPAQPDVLGDVLADYVDAGGRVVMTAASFVAGWEVRGRLLSGGYVPFNLGTGPIGSSTLGDFNTDHPIMEGVQQAWGDLLAAVSLAIGAEWVADWTFGRPMIATNDNGVVAINIFIAAYGYWSGDIPLILHNAAFYSTSQTQWLTADPAQGTVPPGGSVDVTVTFDATDLDGGTYEARLIVESNDPDEPEVVIPAILGVTGVPDIALLGEETSVESTLSYATSGATTFHSLPLTVTPEPGATGSVDLIVDGDYGSSYETATAVAEGTTVGTVGGTGTDCTEASDNFPLSGSGITRLTEDGVVEIEVRNTYDVDVFCANNFHRVRLNYRVAPDSIDYGELFIGLTRTISIEVVNSGRDILEVTSITTDDPDFIPSVASMQLAPRTSAPLDITFAPSRDGLISAILTIESNDPDEPVLTADLSGTGLIPPDIAVSPTSIVDHLFSGETAAQVLAVHNAGGSDLIFDLEIDRDLPGGPADPDAPRSTGEESPGPRDPEEVPGVPLPPGDPDTLGPLDDSFHFEDDFEDGDFDGWLIGPGGGTREVTDETAADGTVYSYHHSGSSYGHFDGIYRTFGQVQPEYIRFFARPSSVSLADAYFVITDPNGLSVIWFYARENGRLYVNGDVGGDISVIYQPRTWYEIEFRNIDFTAKTFDYYVDGELILTAIPFRNSGAVQSFHRLDLYNFHSAGEAWWDEILLTSSTIPEWISLAPTDGVVPPGGRLDVTVDLDAAGLDGGQYHADVRIHSNDPDESEIVVPVDLQVTGAPDIVLRSAPVVLESARAYSTYGAVTHHSLALDRAPSGEGTIGIVAEGDFDYYNETATVIVEGNTLGHAGNTGVYCSAATGSFTLTAEELADLASDGVVSVDVQNSTYVDISCPVNRHVVTLEYSPPLDPMDFGQVFTGYSGVMAVRIRNEGTEVLEVTSISSDTVEFTPSVTSLTLAPRTEADVDVTFAPLDPGPFETVLTIVSDDPDEPQLTVSLIGTGSVPPDIDVTPASLSADLFTNEIQISPLSIGNIGGSDLLWSLWVDSGDRSRVVSQSPVFSTPPATLPPKDVATVPPDPPAEEDVYTEPIPPDRSPTPSAGPAGSLEDLLDELNERSQEITDLVPNRYDFSEGETGTSIYDGGGDMYDGGNYLSTNLGGSIPYSNDTVVDRPDLLGSGGRYFTRKYQGLFVFVADIQGLGHFTIAGNLGANGSGSADGTVLESRSGGTTYLGFVKRVYGAGDPSVNHLIIVREDPDVTHAFSTYTNDDYHRVTGLSNVTRIHYLLYAGAGGTYIDNDAALEIMKAYLSIGPAGWLSAVPDSGAVPAGESAEVSVTFDAAGLFGGDYQAALIVSSNDPDETEVVVPVDMHVTGVPDIAVLGDPVELQSSQHYLFSGATTTHVLPISVPPVGSGALSIIADGDYGSSGETATITAEGLLVGQVGGVGSDCQPASDDFPISAEDLSDLVADGVVGITVRNSSSVGAFCTTNRHTVTLSYQLPADLIDFGPLFIGLSLTQSVLVENRGTDVLEVSSITSDDPQFQASPIVLRIPPRERQRLDIIFSPTIGQVTDATLTIASNDPDQPEAYVQLRGEGVVPPDIQLTPPALAAALFTGGIELQTLSVENVGGSDLIWEARLDTSTGSAVLDTSGPLNTQPNEPPTKEPPDGLPSPPDPGHLYLFGNTRQPGSENATGPPASLEELLVRLGETFASVTARIPSRHDFTEGEIDASIGDGGDDMYDGGNVLSTNHGGPIPYTHGAIDMNAALGGNGRYFTGKFPGLFVMVADPDGVAELTISGNLGADGSGFADGAVLETSVGGRAYLGFVKRVYGTSDPSVNHLVIIEWDPDANHSFSTYTDDDYHRVFDLSGVSRIHYLLYAGESGAYIDDAATLEIMHGYLGAIAASWLSVDVLSGDVPAGQTQNVEFRFDASGLSTSDLAATYTISSNDPDEPSVVVPVTLHVTSAPDIEIERRPEVVTSVQDYTFTGAITNHAFDVFGTVSGVGSLGLTAVGDFDDFSEVATLVVEGGLLGQVGRTGLMCAPASGVFPISEADMTTLLADSRLEVDVLNSLDVDASCPANRHTVTLTYRATPDRMDYGPLFIGLTREFGLVISNAGVEDLTIGSITSDQGDFTPQVTSATIPPGASQPVEVVFAPSTAGPIGGTLTIVSDDPDEGQVTLPLSGVGVIPPDIDVSPESMTETLLIGRQAVRPLTIANTNVGAADLLFKMSVSLFSNTVAPMTPPRFPNEEVPDGESPRTRDLPTDRPPEDYLPVLAQESISEGATVLIIMDAAPWGSAANQQILVANNIAYDVINSVLLQFTDLSRYPMVLVPGDQPNVLYYRLSQQRAQLDAYVENGGTLEFHAAGWGFNDGNSSQVVLPRGVTIEQYMARYNTVVSPDHPIVQGVPISFSGNFASHAYLRSVPGDAVRIVDDDGGHRNLVIYNHGAGRVVVGCQTFEFGFDRGQAAGQILANMIPWVHQTSEGIVSWLEPLTFSGVLSAESSIQIDMTFDSEGLEHQLYETSIVIESNDPDEPEVVVPAALNAVRLIAEAGPPQQGECDGDDGAMTPLDGTGSEHMDGVQFITTYAWYLHGALLGQGATLLAHVPLGVNTVRLDIMDATGAASTDDTTVTVVDTTPPTGSIVHPPPGACVGPSALPLVIEDDYTDVCSENLTRDYGRPDGAVYTAHGDHQAALLVTDPSGNLGPSSSVAFTIDTVPPNVTILLEPDNWEFPKFVPFQDIFSSDDADGATGDVVHEWILVNGCVIYDGLTYGDGDGLLLDESAEINEDELCRLRRLCGQEVWEDPGIEVRATDCGGNMTSASYVKTGWFVAFPCR